MYTWKKFEILFNTRKCLWNTKRSQPPPIRRVLNISYIPMFWTYWVFWPVSVIIRWPKLAATLTRHIIWTIIWAYNKVSLTFCSKVLARTSLYLEKKNYVFDRIRSFPVVESDRNCQKAPLHIKTFYLSL